MICTIFMKTIIFRMVRDSFTLMPEERSLIGEGPTKRKERRGLEGK